MSNKNMKSSSINSIQNSSFQKNSQFDCYNQHFYDSNSVSKSTLSRSVSLENIPQRYPLLKKSPKSTSGECSPRKRSSRKSYLNSSPIGSPNKFDLKKSYPSPIGLGFRSSSSPFPKHDFKSNQIKIENLNLNKDSKFMNNQEENENYIFFQNNNDNNNLNNNNLNNNNNSNNNSLLLYSFDISRHLHERMNSNQFSCLEINRVLKYGCTYRTNNNHLLIGLDDIIIELESILIEQVRKETNLKIKTIHDNQDINPDTLSSPSLSLLLSSTLNSTPRKINANIYRTSHLIENSNPNFGLTTKQFSTWIKLNEFISSTMSEKEPSLNEFEAILEDAKRFHGQKILTKILDWRITSKQSTSNLPFYQSYQVTLLSRACIYGYPGIVRLLRQYGATPTIQNSFWRSSIPPLHCMFISDRYNYAPWCASFPEKDVEVIQAMLDSEYTTSNQIFKCITKKYRFTLLKRAVFSKHQQAVDCILTFDECGNLSIHDDNYETLKELAKSCNIKLSQNIQRIGDVKF